MSIGPEDVEAALKLAAPEKLAALTALVHHPGVAGTEVYFYAIRSMLSSLGMFAAVDPARAHHIVTIVGHRFERWPEQVRKQYLRLAKDLRPGSVPRRG